MTRLVKRACFGALLAYFIATAIFGINAKAAIKRGEAAFTRIAAWGLFNKLR